MIKAEINKFKKITITKYRKIWHKIDLFKRLIRSLLRLTTKCNAILKWKEGYYSWRFWNGFIKKVKNILKKKCVIELEN